VSWRDGIPGERDEDGVGAGEAGRFGGDWRGVRPNFDMLMSWSLPLGRISGIAIRIHWLFLVLIIAQLLRASTIGTGSGGGSGLGMAPMLLLLVGLFWAVLLHELGHCFACRSVGGSANEVLLWPLGGLAWCNPPGRWLAHLITAAGGPLVNLALIALLGPLLGLLTGRWWGVAFPNPLSLEGLLVVNDSWWHMALYLFLWTNTVLLAFNLLPIYPLDGGRILQAALWPRFGYAPAARFAVRAGFVGGIALGIFALVREQLLLLLVAIFALAICQTSIRQLNFSERLLGYDAGPDGGPDGGPHGSHDESDEPDPELERLAKESARAQAEAEEIDRILLKINRSGLDSLSKEERHLLQRATDRRRNRDGGAP